MREKQLLGVSAVLASVLISGVALADEGQWKYSTGMDYSSGDYGGDPVDTDITYIPFTTSYSSGPWTLKATMPWVEIEGAGTVVGAGDGGVVVGGPNQVASEPASTAESGLGDIWLSATYNVDTVPTDLFYLDVAAKVKLPTADEDKGLGTGETDYTLQADIFKPMGNMTPFATLAYKVKGEPAGVELDNVMFLSLGSDFGLSDTTHVGASVDYQEAASSGSDNSLELFGYINQKFNKQWSVTLYGYTGLQDGSPDYGGGFQISYKP